MEPLEITLLRGIRVVLGGEALQLSARQQELTFALLAGGRGLVLDRQLLDLVWNTDIEKHTLHTAVSKLRRRLGKDRISRSDHPGGYQLIVHEGEPVDLWIWSRLLHECSGRYATDPYMVAELGRRVLDMVDLDSLDVLADTPAMMTVRQGIENDYLRTAAQVAEIKLSCGDHVPVIALLRRLVQRYEDREHLRSLLMQALYRDQRPGEALALYDELAAARSQHGREPTPGLQELRERIVNNDLDLLRSEPRPLPAADQAVDRSGGTERPSINRMTGALIVQDPDSPDAYSRAVDRASLLATTAVIPDLVRMEAESHEFAETAVRTASQLGIARFIEIGPPLPLMIHKAARLMQPNRAQTVYVHRDAAFVRHCQRLVGGLDGVSVTNGSVRDTAALLDDPHVRALFDLDQPAVDKRERVAIVDRTDINVTPGPAVVDQYALLCEEAAPGSVLVLVCVSDQISALAVRQLGTVYEYAPESDPIARRSLEEIAALVPPGMRVLDPGIVDVHQFCASPTVRGTEGTWRQYALIAVKE
ncbi:SAM-dependent methyltransferase [Actinomadura sp. WMMA1423]|uniref:SAM-dependent methyltransferase n=1 Tax=Actinomadura sp. WMMA1423 TaxID=2591108 RepID=UPI0011478BA5|nr:SAM-dependent methyltransferase [Actinomadura sp. WMMA1423]